MSGQDEAPGPIEFLAVGEMRMRQWLGDCQARTNIPEQCPACTAELLHPEPICQDCGATTGDDANPED